MEFLKNFNEWLTSPYFNDETKVELKNIELDKKEIEERFYRNLAFGTGGLRGILGAGTNRMNIYTVSKATQGLANTILECGEKAMAMGVAIAYDSRKMSREFCEKSALVLNGNGIKTYIFESLRPTPMLSFAVRNLGCIAGIVITASHNPKEYNGFKVYWEDGAQVTHPKDEEIINNVNSISDFQTIKTMTIEDAKKASLFHVLTERFDEDYNNTIKKLSINPDVIKSHGDKIKIVYTPLHGAGNVPVRRILKDVGFNNVFVVKEQELPDENFKTLDYPNPEDIKAFTLALKLGKEVGADVLIATDPDADRLGCMIKNKDGEYEFLNGNMIGVLMAEYILSEKKARGELPKNGAIISTIVSTNLTREIAKFYDATYFDVLTGFKYIGELIKKFEEDGTFEYLFGFEESYGTLVGTHARDKDAVVAAMMLCEIVAFYKSKGISVFDAFDKIYEKYGYYKESIETLTLKGLDGVQAMAKIMENLRKNPPKEVNGAKISVFRDYVTSKSLNLISNVCEEISLPVSDVLYFEVSNGDWFCVRPSGTEPKIKIYFGVKTGSKNEAEDALLKLSKSVMDLVEKAGQR